MIARVVRAVRAVREAPPSPLDPFIAALMVTVGAGLMARFVRHQRQAMSQAMAELSQLAMELHAAQLAYVGQSDEGYPAYQDLHPIVPNGAEPEPAVGTFAAAFPEDNS